MYIYIHAYVKAHICVIYMHVCMYLCMYVCVYVCRYTRVKVHTYYIYSANMHTHLYSVCIHTIYSLDMHIHLYSVCIHTIQCTYIPVSYPAVHFLEFALMESVIYSACKYTT